MPFGSGTGVTVKADATVMLNCAAVAVCAKGLPLLSITVTLNVEETAELDTVPEMTPALDRLSPAGSEEPVARAQFWGGGVPPEAVADRSV
jgi:uncharacterized glyoxalase superfamily protein PhnB